MKRKNKQLSAFFKSSEPQLSFVFVFWSVLNLLFRMFFMELVDSFVIGSQIVCR